MNQASQERFRKFRETDKMFDQFKKFCDSNGELDIEAWVAAKNKQTEKALKNRPPIILSEFTLRIIEKWIYETDIAVITSFRSELKNVTPNTLITGGNSGDGKFSEDENRLRFLDLRATLYYLHYGVTELGNRAEPYYNVTSGSQYVVTNLVHDKNFKKNIFTLSEYFNQDSFLYKPECDINAYLIGTNHSENPGYGIEKLQGIFTKVIPDGFLPKKEAQGYLFGTHGNPQNILSFDSPLEVADKQLQRKVRKFKARGYKLKEIYGTLRIHTSYSGYFMSFLRQQAKPICEHLKLVRKNA